MKFREERRISLVAVGVFYGVMAGLAIAVSYAFFDAPPVRVGDATSPMWMRVGLGVGVAGLVIGFSRLSTRSFDWARTLDDKLHSLLGTIRPSAAAVMAGTSGLAEELLFRGLVLRLLLPWDGEASVARMSVALVVSSVMFGAMHVGPDRSYLPWTLFATVMGFVFGAVTLWTGDITAAVIAHLSVNYFNFLALGSNRDD